MKKYLLLLPVILVAVSTTAFAGPSKDVNPRAEVEFKKHFANSENVKWSKEEGGFLKATFTWANHLTLAYFDPNGDLVGSIRGISYNQLPLIVLRNVEKSYSNAIILEINEINNDEGTQYKLTIEEANKKYTVRLNSFGETIKKEKIK